MTGVAHPRAVWGWPETGSLSLGVSLSFSLPSPHPTHRAPSRAPQVAGLPVSFSCAWYIRPFFLFRWKI